MTTQSQTTPTQVQEIIPNSLLKSLSEKKVQGGEELDLIIKKFQENKEYDNIKQVIHIINSKLTTSPQPQQRKAGVWGLAIVSVALLKDCKEYLPEIIPKIVTCMNDLDSKVRFAALEAMYNVAKSSKTFCLTYFSEIFDSMFKLSSDGDVSIKNANNFLNRLIKDIVMSDEDFIIEKVIPLIRERVLTNDHWARQFILEWIVVLDSLPELFLVDYLPQFLSGIFYMLNDSHQEIVFQAQTTLQELLNELEERNTMIDHTPICKILLENAVSIDHLKREIALDWLHKIITISGEKLVEFDSRIITAIIPNLSHSSESIRNKATLCDKKFGKLLTSTKQEIQYQEIYNVVCSELEKNTYFPLRISCLNWLKLILKKKFDSLSDHLDDLLKLLLKTLSDVSEEVVFLDLEVLSIISSTEKNFTSFMNNLVNLFKTDQEIFLKSGFIVKKLCVMLDPEKIYREFAKILLLETRFEFCSSFVQTLNVILLTTQELSELRTLIKSSSSSKQGNDLFLCLYKSWVHNPVSTISLCLLAKAFKHSSDLIMNFGEIELTTSLLIQIDHLVQLIESPVFAELRLQLLEPKKHPDLLKTLYGLLMILPQSSSYKKLSKRLESVASLTLLQSMSEINQKNETTETKEFNQSSEVLLKHFIQIQSKHKSYLGQ